MSHFSEDTPVRRGDAFNSGGRAVGVEVYISAHQTFQINVLCRDLAVICEAPYKILVCQETPFSVRYRNTVDVSDLGQGKPGRFIGSYAGAYYARLVTSDAVE